MSSRKVFRCQGTFVGEQVVLDVGASVACASSGKAVKKVDVKVKRFYEAMKLTLEFACQDMGKSLEVLARQLGQRSQPSTHGGKTRPYSLRPRVDRKEGLTWWRKTRRQCL